MSDEQLQKEPTVLFDTELVTGKVGELEHGLQMFQRPVGQGFAMDPRQTKTYDDTNMLMAACLPMPYLFELENVFLSLGEVAPCCVEPLRESFKSAALAIEFGWHYLAMKVGLWYVPENPMETIVQVQRNDRRRENWELREPCKLMKVGANLGQSQMLTVNVKWAPEFKAVLPPSRLRVALVGNLVMPVGYWEFPKQERDG
jgi:hypothetical protein